MFANIILDFYIKLFIGAWYAPYFLMADQEKIIPSLNGLKGTCRK